MDGLAFLNVVWPVSGPYLISIPVSWVVTSPAGEKIQKHGHKQFAFDTAEAAYAGAIHASEHDGEDVYFALGALKALVRDDRGRLIGPRKRANIRALRSFWLDIDVKPGVPTAYDSQGAALMDLKRFVRGAGLPAPVVVSSGVGLHVYWPLTDEVSSDKWDHYAGLFKQIVDAAGVYADPTRTADRTSLLRVPGTMNYKPGRQETPVVVKFNGGVTDTDEFLKRIAFVAGTKNLSVVPPRTKSAINVSSAVALNSAAANTFSPTDPGKVVKRCPHLTWQFRNPTEVPQPLWYAAIGVLRHCVNGDAACHKLSARDPDRYDPGAVDAKIAQLEAGGYGPTTCAKFEAEGSEQCGGCQWRGKIGSPITAATMAEPAPAPKMTALVRGEAVELDLPAPPYPYKRVIDDGADHAKIVIELVEDREGGEHVTEEVVYDYDLYPHTLFFDEATGGYVAKVMHWLPQEGWRDMTLPFGDAYDGRKLSSMFGHIGVMVVGRKRMEYLEGYMRGYIAELQRRAAAQVIYSQLGWKDDGVFVTPGMVVGADSVAPCTVSQNVNHACNNWVQPRGDLETWKDIAAAYEPPECVSLQFTAATGFASILMALTNYRGAIVAAVGEKGCGKTTASWLANSVFNHKNMGDITDRDTGNALYAKLGALKNLLGTYDESTRLDGNTLSSLAYAINQGQGKNRLDRNAQFKENIGNWALMLLMTTNRSPQAILGAFSDDSSAEAARIFQYTVPPRTLTKAFADACFDRLNDNFGLAGPMFVQEVLRMKDVVKDRLKYWIKEIDKRANVSSGERFWSAVPACVLTAVEVCNSIGLLNYDVGGLADFSVRSILIMRTNVSENVGTPVGTLSDYFNTNLRNTLIVGAIPGGTGSVIRHPPTGELRIRVDDGLGRAFIDRTHIHRFCTERGVDFPALREELLASKVLVDNDRKVMLGKGTAIKTAQTRCWEVDLLHAELTGVAGFVKDAASGTNVIPIPGARPVKK